MYQYEREGPSARIGRYSQELCLTENAWLLSIGLSKGYNEKQTKKYPYQDM